MPDNYFVIRSERVPLNVGSDEVKDGQDSLVQAVPSGVQFHVVVIVNEATFNDPALLNLAIDGVASPYSDYFNHDVTVPGVVALTTFQDFDDNNNLRSVLSVTISGDNPDVTTTREAPFTTAIPSRFEAFVAQTQAALNALPQPPASLIPTA